MKNETENEINTDASAAGAAADAASAASVCIHYVSIKGGELVFVLVV